MAIRVILLDVDGVLTEGEGRPLDLELMGQLASMNRAARQDGGLPAVTLCTGRPAPYLEVMLQAIDGHLPGIFENGAGLYIPDPYTFLPHPNLANSEGIEQIRTRLERGVVKPGHAFIQPGKIYSLTLFATDPSQTRTLDRLAREALGDLSDQVDLVYSTSCVNVLPRSVDKGQGVEFLASRIGISPQDMLGVGDSDVDLPFLALVGRSAAPSNANREVRELVDYVSPLRTSQGVRDILSHFELM